MGTHVTHVYVKKGRQPQKYRVKYDGGQTMTSLEERMESTALEEEDSDQSSAIEELEGSDYEASEGIETTVEVQRTLWDRRGSMKKKEEMGWVPTGNGVGGQTQSFSARHFTIA